MAKGQRAEDVDDDLDVDLAHALERSPVEGVLVQKLAGARRFDVSAAEVDGVALEQLDLLVAEHVGVVVHVLLEAKQTLVARLQRVAQPDASYTVQRHIHALQTQFVGHSLLAVRRVLERVGEDLLLDLGLDAVGMRRLRATSLLDQAGHASDLEGAAHLVERVAVVAHQPAGLRDVAG